jgi:hypothetical protein
MDCAVTGSVRLCSGSGHVCFLVTLCKCWNMDDTDIVLLLFSTTFYVLMTSGMTSNCEIIIAVAVSIYLCSLYCYTNLYFIALCIVCSQ